MSNGPLGLQELLRRLIEADVRFVGDRTLVATDLGHVDVLQGLPQVPPFRVLDEKAKEVDIDGLVVRVCSLEHLLEMKRSSDRAIDRVDLDALEAAQGDGRKGN